MKKNLNIPVLVCLAAAVLLWILAPVMLETTYLDVFKDLLSDLGSVGDLFALSAYIILPTLVTLVAIILCAVFAFKGNKKALNTSAIVGVAGTLVALILGVFLASNKMGVGFGDTFSAVFDLLKIGFWLNLIPFVGVLVLNKKAAE